MNRRRLKTCLFGGYEKQSVLEYTQTLLLGYQWEILQLQRQLEEKNALLKKEQAKLTELNVELNQKDMLLKDLREEKVQRASVPILIRQTKVSGSDRRTDLPDQGAREL